MQKRVWYGVLLSGLCLLLALIIPSSTQAQTDEDPPIEPTELESDIGDEVPFDLVGFNGETLQQDNRTMRLTLTIPAHWQLLEGAELVLNIQTFIYENGLPAENIAGGWLEIEFNGVPLNTIALERNGPQTLTFPLPTAALASSNGRFPLNISLITNFGCNSPRATTVRVMPTSSFTLPHRLVPPPTDLRQLPHPIQQGSFLPDEAILVVPDEPTPAELEAILTVAAGMGRMTSRTELRLLTASEVTEEIRTQFHLIFVGRQDHFPMLSDVSLPLANGAPAPAKESGVSKTTEETEAEDSLATATAVAAEEGTLQMAVSPWNQAKVVLVVSGKTDAATTKAAQAIAYGTIRVNEEPSVAIINDVYFTEVAAPLQTDVRTIGDLGYQLTTLSGASVNSADYRFFVPPGLTLQEDETATFNLVYSHSALLDYEGSGLVVLLNGTPVGSTRLNEDSTAVQTMQMEVPATLLQPGDNTLSVEAELKPLDLCSDLRNTGTWFNIYPESTLYLPLEPMPPTEMAAPALNRFPQPYSFDETLRTTAFVLPQRDPESWFMATQLAYALGRQVNGDLLDLDVIYANDAEAVAELDRHLFIIGMAEKLPILDRLNEHLPAAFVDDSNRINHDRLPVAYEIPADVPLGYLQIARSPWRAERQIILLSGDSVEGLQNATTTLLTAGRQLKGDLAVVESDNLFVTSSEELEPAAAADGAATSETAVGGENATAAEATEEPSTSEETAVAPTDEDADTAAVSSDVPQPTAVAAENEAETTIENTPSAAAGSNDAVQRDRPTALIVALVVCLILLGVIGVRAFWNNRQAI